MELVLLFAIVLGFTLVLYGFSKFTEERRLKARLLIIGSFLLLGLWVGLFLETPEMKNGTWIAIAVTCSFLLGLSIFFLLFFQVFSEKFYSLPALHFSHYALHPVFLNLFCFINAIFLSVLGLSVEVKILVASLISHIVVLLLYVYFYHRVYNQLETVAIQIQFKLYIFFAVVSLLYFAIGFMALFVLTPLHPPDSR